METRAMLNRRTRPARIAALVILTLVVASQNDAPAEKSNPLVLVELFTSEGCSSCPPADELLADLYESQSIKGTTIVPMSFHVDYWDRLGWKDPFGDAAYSRRQRAYAGLLKSDRVYTPQMIVNGTAGFVGSNRGAAQNAIRSAGEHPAAEIRIDTVELERDELIVTVSMEPMQERDLILWAAIVEDDLESEVTRGENRGRRLKHEAVVRAFQGESYRPAAKPDDNLALSLPWEAPWKKGNCRVVVAVQSKQSGAIHALGQRSVVATP